MDRGRRQEGEREGEAKQRTFVLGRSPKALNLSRSDPVVLLRRHKVRSVDPLARNRLRRAVDELRAVEVLDGKKPSIAVVRRYDARDDRTGRLAVYKTCLRRDTRRELDGVVRDGADTSVRQSALVHSENRRPREIDDGGENEGVDGPVDEVEGTGGGGRRSEDESSRGLGGSELGKGTVAGEALTLGEGLSGCRRLRVGGGSVGGEVQRVAVASLLFLLLEGAAGSGRSRSGRRVDVRVLGVDGRVRGGRALLEDFGEGRTLGRLFGDEGSVGGGCRSRGNARGDDVVGGGVDEEECRDKVRPAE